MGRGGEREREGEYRPSPPLQTQLPLPPPPPQKKNGPGDLGPQVPAQVEDELCHEVGPMKVQSEARMRSTSTGSSRAALRSRKSRRSAMRSPRPSRPLTYTRHVLLSRRSTPLHAAAQDAPQHSENEKLERKGPHGQSWRLVLPNQLHALHHNSARRLRQTLTLDKCQRLPFFLEQHDTRHAQERDRAQEKFSTR